MLHRRTFLHLSAFAVAQLAFQRVVRAQSYPDRPITLVVPFPAGGPTDVIARIFAERCARRSARRRLSRMWLEPGRPSALRGLSGPRLTATRSPLAIRPAMLGDLRST